MKFIQLIVDWFIDKSWLVVALSIILTHMLQLSILCTKGPHCHSGRDREAKARNQTFNMRTWILIKGVCSIQWISLPYCGRNPAPVERCFIPSSIGFQPSKVVQEWNYALFVIRAAPIEGSLIHGWSTGMSKLVLTSHLCLAEIFDTLRQSGDKKRQWKYMEIPQLFGPHPGFQADLWFIPILGKKYIQLVMFVSLLIITH